MLWKYQADKEDWDELDDSDSKYHQQLRRFVHIIELISVLTGYGELTITSFIRLDNKKSLHYYARALDIRVKDKPVIWYYAMCLIGIALGWLNKLIRMQPHYELYGKPRQHIHIEIRNKNV